jgi:ornithine carbamoyltransferase
MNENRLVMARDLLERRVGRRRGHPEASFLAISELTKGEFLDLLRGGIEMKTQPQKYVNVLQGASVALLFQKTSTRTRCSFETGTAELGGHAPPGYGPNPEIAEAARREGAKIDLTVSPGEAVASADVLYTDTWVSMGAEAETERRLKAFRGHYQVNLELLSKAPAHALIMHCLPAHRGQEITAEAINHPNSIIFDQAENRKHVQKYLLGKLAHRLKGPR